MKKTDKPQNIKDKKGSHSQSPEIPFCSIKTTSLGFGCISLVITWKQLIWRHIWTLWQLEYGQYQKKLCHRLCYRWHMTLCLWVEARAHETKTSEWHNYCHDAPATHTSLPSIECCFEFRSTNKRGHDGIRDELLTSDTGQYSYLALETTESSRYAGKRSRDIEKSIQRV